MSTTKDIDALQLLTKCTNMYLGPLVNQLPNYTELEAMKIN